MMTAAEKREANRRKAASHRERQRAKGLRLVQHWLPDTRSKAFIEEAARQSKILNESPHIGTLKPEDMQRLDRAVMIFLGLS
jgi:hypothetical protein